MQALLDSHLNICQLKTNEFFKSAYLWKFKRDCLDITLANDVKSFDESGKIPAYVCDYIINIYGVH